MVAQFVRLAFAYDCLWRYLFHYFLGKRAGKGKDKAKEQKLKPNDHELRDTICKILKEVDFNTVRSVY